VITLNNKKHTHVIELEQGTEEEIAWLASLDPSMEHHPAWLWSSHVVGYTVGAYVTLSPTPAQITMLHVKYGSLMTIYTPPSLH
jgi:hypothetical protein